MTKKIFLKPLAVLMFLLLAYDISFGVEAGISSRKCKVKYLIGRVEYKKVSGKWKKLRLNSILRTGYEVRTYIESSVILVTDEGTELNIGEKSMIKIKTLKQDPKLKTRKSEIQIKVGNLYAKVKKLSSKRSSFMFETPVATAAIRGTKLELNVSGKGTSIKVFEGLVFVKPRKGRGANVRYNQKTFIKKGQSKVRVEVLAEPPPKDPDTTNVDTSAVDTSGTDTTVATDTTSTDTTSVDTSSVRDTTVTDTTNIDTVVTVDTTNTKEDTVVVQDTTNADTVSVRDTSSTDSSSGSAGAGLVVDNLPPFVDAPQVVVSGKVAIGGRVKINGKETSVGATGNFKMVTNLKFGKNIIRVASKVGAKVEKKKINIEYRPKLKLEVSNIVDGAVVTSSVITLDVKVTQGARFSVNGLPVGVNKVAVKPGANVIKVKAWDRWGRQEEQSFNVTYEVKKDFFLNVITPVNGSVSVTKIVVSGSTMPGSEVTVDGQNVTVSSTGAFKYIIPIPDEDGDYSIEIISERGSNRKTETREVSYKKKKIPLSLVVTSPAEGEIISSNPLSVSGIAVGATEVHANGRSLPVGTSGNFNTMFRLAEKDIGDYALNVTALNDDEDISKEINLVIDGTSPRINISIPRVSFVGSVGNATKQNVLKVFVNDNTPDDKIILSAEINGEKIDVETSSGSREEISLELGKNKYKITAHDMANNISNVLVGEITSIPKPPRINLINPRTPFYRVSGIPPAPMGGRRPAVDVEVEIDDGIGDEPENIVFVKATGRYGSVTLYNESGYVYSKEIEIGKGQNRIEITVKDIAGNITNKVLNILWQD